MIETNIYAILTGSTEVTDLVSTNIFNHHLPDNFDLDEDALVFIVNKDEGLSSLDAKDELEFHTLRIIVVGADTLEIEAVVSAVEDVLNEYSDDNVRDCTTTSISPTLDAEKDRYIKEITFNIIYNE